MSADRLPAARRRRVPWGFLSVCALIVLILALATLPLGELGACFDSAQPGASFCETMPASLLGTPTSWIAWPLVSVVVLVLLVGGRALLRHTSDE